MRASEPVPTWSGDVSGGWARLLRRTAAPLALTMLCPILVLWLWPVSAYLGGSLSELAKVQGWITVVTHLPIPTWSAAATIVGFVFAEALLLRVLPGRIMRGPLTPMGDRPEYRLNGSMAWILTHVAFFGVSYGLGWFSPGVLHDRFSELLVTMAFLCSVFCGLLYLKGRVAPSTPDASSSGNFVTDFFWGTELQPVILGINLKQLFTCRIGMMAWSLTVLSFAAHQAQHRLSTGLAVSVALQVIYILKFFSWEAGYFVTLDAIHDRFGFYLCWGVATWIPGFYTVTAQYLVEQPYNPPPFVAGGLFVVGLAAIYLTYAVDRQRDLVRQARGSKAVWGHPPRLIRAPYTTADGAQHENLLLASGWWGLARHFNYVPEFIAATAWSVAAGTNHLLPYLYLIFLTVLLVDRAARDDRRCQAKYGKAWSEYRKAVPWKIVPYVY